MNLSSEKAIFLFVNKDVLPPTGTFSVLEEKKKKKSFYNFSEYCVANVEFIAAALMSHVYERYKDEDGFLYVTYSGENTFGAF